MENNIIVDPKDAEENKIMAILAYFGILVLVPLLAAKESAFARFHANQGLLLLIAGIALSIAASILMFIVVFISYTLIFVVYGILSIASIGLFVLAIIGIINAAKGEAKELPLIGKYTILK